MVTGIQAETPSDSRLPPSTSSHRLQTRGQRSSRHAPALDGRSIPRLSPSISTRASGSAARHPFPGHSLRDPHFENEQRRLFRDAANRHLPAQASRQSFGMFGRLRTDEPLPDHPFQLENTLNHIQHHINGRSGNATSTNSNRNFNQRTQLLRSNARHRTASGESSQSSNSGGVHLHSDGSSSTVGPGPSGRRKRLLSISSDGSLGGGRAAC